MFCVLKSLLLCFVKYLIVGGMGFVLDFAVLSCLYALMGVHYLIAATCGFMAGLVFVYIASNEWVFDRRQYRQHAWLEFVIFAIIGLVGLGLTVLFMWVFVDGLDIYPLIAKLITTVLVLMWNFGARKWILY